MALTKDGIMHLRTEGFKQAATAMRAFGASLGFASRELTKVNAQALALSSTRAVAQAVRSSFSSAVDGLRSSFRTLSISLATVGAGAFGLFRLIQQGERVQNVATGFERLAQSVGGASTVLAGLTRATGGGVSQTNLMVSANRLLAAQLGVSRERMERLFTAGTTLGRALGFTATEGVERMSLALAKQEPELLDELGIKVDLTKAVSAYAKANGVAVGTIDAQARARIFLEAVERQAIERSAALGSTTLSTASASEILSAKWANLVDRLTLMLARSPELIDALGSIAEAALKIATALVPVVELVAKFIGWLAKAPEVLTGIGGALAGMKIGAGVGSAFGPIGTLVGGAVGGIAGGVGGALLGASAGEPAQGPIQINVTQTVPIHDGSVERVAAAAGRDLARAMHRRIDGVQSDVGRGLRAGFDEQVGNSFEVA